MSKGYVEFPENSRVCCYFSHFPFFGRFFTNIRTCCEPRPNMAQRCGALTHRLAIAKSHTWITELKKSNHLLPAGRLENAVESAYRLPLSRAIFLGETWHREGYPIVSYEPQYITNPNNALLKRDQKSKLPYILASSLIPPKWRKLVTPVNMW